MTATTLTAEIVSELTGKNLALDVAPTEDPSIFNWAVSYGGVVLHAAYMGASSPTEQLENATSSLFSRLHMEAKNLAGVSIWPSKGYRAGVMARYSQEMRDMMAVEHETIYELDVATTADWMLKGDAVGKS